MLHKIFVTGGTGFLGAYIIKHLVQKGYAVTALRRTDNLPDFIEPEIWQQVQWVTGDVLDYPLLTELIADADAIIHAAAVVSFDKKEAAAMHAVNVEGTANMVNAALECGNIQRFIYISSIAAIGRNTTGTPINESCTWERNKNTTEYSKSKHKAEMQVWRAFAEGLNGAMLNPTTILGYGDWNKSSNVIFKTVYKRFKYYSAGSNGFVDVEDVAALSVMLLESNITDNRFIANGGNWSFKKLMDTIADGFAMPAPQKLMPRWLANIAWRLSVMGAFITGKPAVLTREKVRVAMLNTVIDNSKITAAFPAFKFTPLEQTIRQACKKYAVKNKTQ